MQFGSFSGVGTGTIRFKAENNFSRKNEDVYGWAFSLGSSPSKIVIRETIQAPAATEWEWDAQQKDLDIQVSDSNNSGVGPA